jgi:hypothetical protein
MVHQLVVLALLFLALHAAAGVIAFVAGVLSLRLAVLSGRFHLYLAALVAMVVFVAGAVAIHWPALAPATRWIYGGLLILGLYMISRAAHAGRLLRHVPSGRDRGRYIDDVGFTLISLFDGFVIVAAIDLRAPGWAVALLALAGVAAGSAVINRVQARVGRAPAQAPG